MSHSADKISIRGRDRSFALRQYTHVAAEAGAAGGSRDRRFRFYENIDQPFFYRLSVYRLRGRDDYQTDIPVALFALQYLCRDPQILDSPIGAGADHRLIYLDMMALAHWLGVAWQVREGDLGFYF